MLSDRRALNPIIANIQLDAEKPDITSPDLTPAATMSEIQIVGHSMTAADVEMGEPAVVLDAQPKDVSLLVSALARDQMNTHLLNPGL